MATASSIQVTSGSGPRLSTGPTRTEGGSVIQDQIIILGEPYVATYILTCASVISLSGSTSTTILQIMNGATLNIHMRSLKVQQFGLAASAGAVAIDLRRITAAGTGGSSSGVAVNPHATTDAASGAAATTLPTGAPTLGVRLGIDTLGLVAAQPVNNLNKVEWEWDPWEVPLVIPAGTNNGLAVNMLSGTSTATVFVEAVWIEVPF